jgi:hypothetical protein
MADRSLLLLLDEVRGKTIRLLQGVSESDALWTPQGLNNHILWHAGHAFVLLEWMAVKALDREPQIPHHWFDMFSWKSEPAKVPSSRWPKLAAVTPTLSSQHMRLHRLIGELTEEQLSASARTSPNHTVRYSILHGLHDEACHGGEIALLRKLLQAKGRG